MAGAEKLLGNGDMLFNPVGISKPVRVQGCYISEKEIESTVRFIKEQSQSSYDDEIIKEIEKHAVATKKKGAAAQDDDGGERSDELLPKAIEIVVDQQMASTTLLQRKLKLGYARAANIIDALEKRGL
jgi:S-DNA-T family DNA segregation ATPase FtsK/SpoIIIE